MQEILDDAMEISRIPMVLYDADGNEVASTLSSQEEWKEAVHGFLVSDIDTQSIGNLHYFKVFVLGTLSYVLLVLNYTQDALTIGRLTASQIRRLLESSVETVTKSGFLRNLLSGSMAPAEITRQAKKLKLTPVTWMAFVLEYEDGFGELPAYEMLDHGFAGNKNDLCCAYDEQHLLLIKNVKDICKASNARKETDAFRMYAQTLADSFRAEIMIPVHVGYSSKADSFEDISAICQEALMALRIRRTFFMEQDTVAYERLGIGRLLVSLPKDLCEIFLYEVFGDHLPDDLTEEEKATIQKFYENDLNISETARQLYLHRNTLVYRLERLQKRLGLDITKFEDAMTFKLAMMVLAHVRSKTD